MKEKIHLLPKHRRMLAGLGERLKLARLRRRLSAALLAERAGISRATLHNVEKGSPSVAMGHYFSVMRAMSLEGDFELLAEDDVFGRRLQDSELITKRRAPKRKKIDVIE